MNVFESCTSQWQSCLWPEIKQDNDKCHIRYYFLDSYGELIWAMACLYAGPERSAERSPGSESLQNAASKPHPSQDDAESSEALEEFDSSHCATEEMSIIGPGHDREHAPSGPAHSDFVRSRRGLCVVKEVGTCTRSALPELIDDTPHS